MMANGNAAPSAQQETPNVRDIVQLPEQSDLTPTVHGTEDVPTVEDGTPSGSSHPELARRDFEWCSLLVKNTSDVKEVEDLLKTKIQSGSSYYPFRRREEVFGFWHLMLDADAQKAVQEHDGIHYFKVGTTKLNLYRALPDPKPVIPRKEEWALGKKNHLTPRAGDWVKQLTRDKSMLMDSQYEYV